MLILPDFYLPNESGWKILSTVDLLILSDILTQSLTNIPGGALEQVPEIKIWDGVLITIWSAKNLVLI